MWGILLLTRSSAGWSTGWRTARCFWHGKNFAAWRMIAGPRALRWNSSKSTRAAFLWIDARNGFEDDPADVEWGFSFLLPEMAKASCQGVAFLMAEVSAIEEEMDLWTRECLRYFPVQKASSYVEAVRQLKTKTTGPK